MQTKVLDAELTACISSLEACQKERNEWKEKYLYARADFDNAQRRMAKDMERLIWDGQAKVFVNYLTLLLILNGHSSASRARWIYPHL